MSGHIVIVEDDVDQRANYEALLKRRNYDVHAFGTKDEAMSYLQLNRPDLLILDIILGVEYDGGFNLYNEVQRIHADIPVLFLTDRDSEIDKVTGLRMGAWDYQPKPITKDFLAAKVETLMRLSRVQSMNDSAMDNDIVRGPLILNKSTRRVSWDSQPIETLTVTEFNMLYALVEHPGVVITYDQFATVTHCRVVENNTISTHVKNLKTKLKRVDANFKAIVSEYGLGYRWQM